MNNAIENATTDFLIDQHPGNADTELEAERLSEERAERSPRRAASAGRPVYLTIAQICRKLDVSYGFLRKHTNEFRSVPGAILTRTAHGQPKWLIPEEALAMLPGKSAPGRPRKAVLTPDASLLPNARRGKGHSEHGVIISGPDHLFNRLLKATSEFDAALRAFVPLLRRR